MYKRLTIISFLMLVASYSRSFAQQFTLTGKIDGNYKRMIYLWYDVPGKERVVDSCVIRSGSFSFKGSLPGPTEAGISISKMYTNIYLEPGKMTLTITDFPKLKMTGSRTQAESEELQAKYDVVNKDVGPISAQMNDVGLAIIKAKRAHRSKTYIASLNKKLQAYEKQELPFEKQQLDVSRQFIITHPNSLISMMELDSHAYRWPLDTILMFYKGFSPPIQASSYGVRVKKQIAGRQAKFRHKHR